MEAEKCQTLSIHLYMNLHNDNWYNEFENLAPKVLTSWATLHKHFRVKWLGANPNILLEIPKNKPLAVSTATMTPRKCTTHECEDAP